MSCFRSLSLLLVALLVLPAVVCSADDIGEDGVAVEKVDVEEDVTHVTTKKGKCIKARVKDGDLLYVTFKGTTVDPQDPAKKEYVFDSTVEKPPFKFLAGTDTGVIPGLHLAVKDMCLLEQRTATIPPRFAYGAKGDGAVQPGATIKFELTLIMIVPKKVNDKLAEQNDITVDGCVHKAAEADMVRYCLEAGAFRRRIWRCSRVVRVEAMVYVWQLRCASCAPRGSAVPGGYRGGRVHVSWQ